VAGCCEGGDEPSGSCATELVSRVGGSDRRGMLTCTGYEKCIQIFSPEI
jgi:hypothetical protein